MPTKLRADTDPHTFAERRGADHRVVADDAAGQQYRRLDHGVFAPMVHPARITLSRTERGGRHFSAWSGPHAAGEVVEPIEVRGKVRLRGSGVDPVSVS